MDNCAENFGANLAQMDDLKVKKMVKQAKKVGKLGRSEEFHTQFRKIFY